MIERMEQSINNSLANGIELKIENCKIDLIFFFFQLPLKILGLVS